MQNTNTRKKKKGGNITKRIRNRKKPIEKKTEKNILLTTKNIIGKIKTYGRTSIDHGQLLKVQ